MNLLYNNFPLWASLIAIGIAQVIKPPLYFFTLREWKWQLLFSTGGMPSSHSAAVISLTTAIALQEGLDSPLFAMSTIFSIITMFDAAGVRRHAGEHAAAINQLVEEIQHIRNINWSRPGQEQEKLKELLGHRPSEVIIGGGVGFFVAVLLDYFKTFLA